MCRFTHPLAAIGAIRWPESGRKRGHPRRVGPPDPVVGNHPVAETTEFGTIRWPKPQIHGAETKLLNYVVFGVKLYVCRMAHIHDRRRNVRNQMTSVAGSRAPSVTFGRSRMDRCRFAKAHVSGRIVEPACPAKATVVTCCMDGVVARGSRYMCPRTSSGRSKSRWRTGVDSRI
jgi:hypothetical protein